MEDFGYQKTVSLEKKTIFPAKKASLTIVAILSIVGFVYFTISAYRSMSGRSGRIPLVKSPAMPIKISGEEIEGNQLDDSDSARQIYEDIFGNKADPAKGDKIKIRSNQEPPSPPRDSEKIALKDKNSLKKPISDNKYQSSEKNPDGNNLAESKKDVEKSPSSSATSQKNRRDLGTNFVGKDLSASVPKTESEVGLNEGNSKSSAQLKNRKIRVQIAALSSKEMAQQSWEKSVELNPDLFNGLKPFVVKADLGNRGIFYRLQVGEFYNQVSAEDFCSRFVLSAKKSRSQCIIVE